MLVGVASVSGDGRCGSTVMMRSFKPALSSEVVRGHLCRLKFVFVLAELCWTAGKCLSRLCVFGATPTCPVMPLHQLTLLCLCQQQQRSSFK